MNFLRNTKKGLVKMNLEEYLEKIKNPEVNWQNIALSDPKISNKEIYYNDEQYDHLYDLYKSNLIIKKLKEGDHFEFDLKNDKRFLHDTNLIPCSGWDGISKKCNCGIRKVRWDEINGVLYAVAYG